MCSVIVHIDFQDLAVNISHQNGQKSWPWGEKNQNWSAAHRHLSSTPYELCCGTQTLKSFRIDLGVTASVATHTQNKYGRGLASGERAPRLWNTYYNTMVLVYTSATNVLLWYTPPRQQHSLPAGYHISWYTCDYTSPCVSVDSSRAD